MILVLSIAVLVLLLLLEAAESIEVDDGLAGRPIQRTAT